MLNQSNSARNLSSLAAQPPSEYCHRFQDEDHFKINYLVTLASIILNTLCCPFMILMNALVIVAIKTRRRLHGMYYVLLACLAGTDLLVGTVTQPTFIAAESFAIAGGSVNTYCNIFDNVLRPFFSLSILSSLFHLAFISIERYIALKYALRYVEIVTKLRLALAVGFSWFLSLFCTLFRTLKGKSQAIGALLLILVFSSLLVIAFCHLAVYLITRRHEKQISTEQIPGEAAAKFLEERKAWKTTGIIVCFVFLSYLVGVAPILAVVFGFISQESRNVYFLRNIADSCLMLNSLCNPIIYCWRSKKIRKAITGLIIRKKNQPLTIHSRAVTRRSNLASKTVGVNPSMSASSFSSPPSVSPSLASGSS